MSTKQITASYMQEEGTGRSVLMLDGPQGRFAGYETMINIGAKETKNGWRFGPLGVVVGDQAYDIYDHLLGQFITSFGENDWVGVVQYIYKTLTSGLVSTVYAPQDTAHTTEQEKPLEATTEAPTGNDPHPHSITGMLQRIEDLEDLVASLQLGRETQAATIDSILAILKAHETRLDIHRQVLLAVNTTDPAPGYEDRVNKAILAQLAGATTDLALQVVQEANTLLETACSNPGCKNGLIALGEKCLVCQGTGKVEKPTTSTEPAPKEDTTQSAGTYMIGMFEDPKHGPNWVEWAIYTLGNLQTSDEINAQSTEYRNGVGFNSSDASFGTSLYNWLCRTRDTQPHLTAKQLESAKKIVKKYVGTQLVPALRAEAWGGPHIASPFKYGDWVLNTVANERLPRRVVAHDWLHLYFEGGGHARWFDCIECEPTTTEPVDGAGLEDMEL